MTKEFIKEVLTFYKSVNSDKKLTRRKFNLSQNALLALIAKARNEYPEVYDECIKRERNDRYVKFLIRFKELNKNYKQLAEELDIDYKTAIGRMKEIRERNPKLYKDIMGYEFIPQNNREYAYANPFPTNEERLRYRNQLGLCYMKKLGNTPLPHGLGYGEDQDD